MLSEERVGQLDRNVAQCSDLEWYSIPASDLKELLAGHERLRAAPEKLGVETASMVNYVSRNKLGVCNIHEHTLRYWYKIARLEEAPE